MQGLHGLLCESSTRTPTPWALIAVGAVTVIYLAIIRPMRKNKQQKDPLSRTPSHASLAQQRGVEREMTNLLVEYEEMIRRMTAQVDTRTAKLELLLREADEKLAQLKSAAAASGPNGTALAAGRTSPAALPAPAPAAGANGAAAADTAEPAPPAADVPDPRHQEVYTLADRGRTTRQIARELKRPQGEVELILALRGAKP